MRVLLDGFLRVFSSLALSVALLLMLGLLTWLGTLEQVDHGLFEVQKRYFESFFLVHHAGSIPIPLPGANLVLCLLFVNLAVGGMARMRRDRRTAGILIAHAGILILLLSGFVKMYFSDDGHVTLFEDQRANHFESYYRWEIAIAEDLGDGRLREHVVPQEDFADAQGDRTARLGSPELPFEVEVSHYMPNSRPTPKGPMFEVAVPVVDGVFLQGRELAAEAETNIAGAYVSVVERDGTRTDGILWGMDAHPLTVTAGGKDWAIDLRHERYAMPFTIELEKFTKVDHPRINMPKEFSSDVAVIEGEASRPVKISMNEPLREAGLVLYQASWGPGGARPGDRLFSTLSVVRNPADKLPLYACIVIAAGLVIHFTRKLAGYVRREAGA